MLWHVGVFFSRCFNWLLGGTFSETTSHRLARSREACGFCRFCCKLLHLIDAQHCDKSITIWKARHARMQAQASLEHDPQASVVCAPDGGGGQLLGAGSTASIR
jgi:hypothetical protein